LIEFSLKRIITLEAPALSFVTYAVSQGIDLLPSDSIFQAGAAMSVFSGEDPRFFSRQGVPFRLAFVSFFSAQTPPFRYYS